MVKKIYFIVSVLLLLFLPENIWSQDNKPEGRDFYTQIADMEQKGQTNRPMEKIGEVSLPDGKTLVWSHSKKHRFKELPKMTTKEQMLRELEKIRSQHAVFLRDLAPEMETTRLEFRVEKMQFRYETEEDRSDFNRLVRGEGDWIDIDMPYYHGPQGPSTAWYRAEIDIPEEMFRKAVLMLHFNGADYYTDAFVNGHHIGFHEGMLDEFEFDMKAYAKPGKNVLLVKVRNDYSMLGGEGVPRRWGNKLSASNSPGWDDPFSGWSCCPTGYGIYQDVYVVAKETPFIADLFCRPLLDRKAVELWVETDLPNGEEAGDFLVTYSLYGQNFEAEVIKDKKKQMPVEGGRVLSKALVVIPDTLLRIWSPEEPWLYQMQVTLSSNDGRRILDTRKQQFGMRSFELRADSRPKGRMYLNGKEIRLRGANTMGFLQLDVMHHDWNRLCDDLLLAKLTNMNFIRTTQRIMPKEVYEYADRLGIMMQADLPLFAYINQKQYTEILKQASGIERVLRNHPSVILFSYLNEPMAEVKPHAISRYAYERLFDALDIVVRNENPDRAVKYVDGDYQAPSNGYPDNHCYNVWYEEHGVGLKEMCCGAWMPVSKGWMYGCGEFGAEGLDPVDLMMRRYPKEWLKKETDGSWSPRYMRGIYQGEQTYGKHWDWFETEYTMEDWVNASHEHQRWGVAKVARAFRRMPRMNSFAVHLFIDAWPNGWMKALMDCERTPKPAWFAYRDALTPFCIQVETERTAFYSEDSYPFRIWICNDTPYKNDCRIFYQLESDGKVLDTGVAGAEVPDIEQAVAFQGYLPVKMPKVKKKTKVFLRATIYDESRQSYVDEDVAEIWVYPRLQQKDKRICVIGGNEDANALLRVLCPGGMKKASQISSADEIVIAGSLTLQQYNEINEAVRNGAKALVLHAALQDGNMQKRLGCELSKGNDSSWILCRNRSHEWVRDMDKRELFYVYSSLTDSPARFVFSTFTASGFRSVLSNTDRMLVGEKSEGKGRWVLCGLALEGMLDANPPLAGIFYRMLQSN